METQAKTERKNCHNQTEFLSGKLTKRRKTHNWNAVSFASIRRHWYGKMQMKKKAAMEAKKKKNFSDW